jgi:hypothetical protein
MENTGLKGLGVTLWQRVVLSYKSTFIGIGVIILSVVAENLVNSPNKIIAIIGSIIGSVLILIKDQTAAPTTTP